MDKPAERQRKREPDRPSSTSTNCVVGAGDVLLHVELRDTRAGSPAATLEIRRDGPEETQIVEIQIQKHEVAVFAQLFSALWEDLQDRLGEQTAQSATTLPIAHSRYHI